MYFESLQEILSMAGHGAYVWASYGISLLVIAGLLVWPQRSYRRQLDLLARSAQAGKSTVQPEQT